MHEAITGREQFSETGRDCSELVFVLDRTGEPFDALGKATCDLPSGQLRRVGQEPRFYGLREPDDAPFQICKVVNGPPKSVEVVVGYADMF